MHKGRQSDKSAMFIGKKTEHTCFETEQDGMADEEVSCTIKYETSCRKHSWPEHIFGWCWRTSSIYDCFLRCKCEKHTNNRERPVSCSEVEKPRKSDLEDTSAHTTVHGHQLWLTTSSTVRKAMTGLLSFHIAKTRRNNITNGGSSKVVLVKG